MSFKGVGTPPPNVRYQRGEAPVNGSFFDQLAKDAPIDKYLWGIFYTGNSQVHGLEDIRGIPRVDSFSELQNQWATRLQGNEVNTQIALSLNARRRHFNRNDGSHEHALLHTPNSQWFSKVVEQEQKKSATPIIMYNNNRKYGL